MPNIHMTDFHATLHQIIEEHRRRLSLGYFDNAISLANKYYNPHITEKELTQTLKEINEEWEKSIGSMSND